MYIYYCVYGYAQTQDFGQNHEFAVQRRRGRNQGRYFRIGALQQPRHCAGVRLHPASETRLIDRLLRHEVIQAGSEGFDFSCPNQFRTSARLGGVVSHP